MVCETHLTTYINLLLEAIISVSRGLFCREPYGYQIHSQMSRVQHFPHNSDDLAELVNNVNFMLEKLVDWCRFNKMALNPTKCEFMLFTNKHILNEPIIKLSGQVLSRVNSFKYLGIYVDDKLKFDHHVDHLKARLAILWHHFQTETIF